MALGFIVGFWGVCGSLIIKQSWRRAYFKFVEEMKDRLFVFIAVYCFPKKVVQGHMICSW
ncbi:LRR receptor-like serine/threonine-protein kinase FLS2-like protein [Corchorus olitorius]|uniref:LRR receptor-like serine/threonine-protein kinase FLS2-like protein n=1 Tax=Corchorus olitorius TaxID=93759 RepID=A0A1R3J066_9ROSI|nr:LRR receptor-like serine/threonine-protein kinase FLS2-like protein [Corchorus olitorius]